MAAKPPLIGLLALALLGCAPMTTTSPDAKPAAQTSEPSSPGAHPAAQGTEPSPPHPVETSPTAPPEAHPLAPESVPNKPEPIPEEMPGTTPPR